MDKWTPEDCLRLIEKYRVTTSHMVPTQFHRLLALPDGRARDATTCSLDAHDGARRGALPARREAAHARLVGRLRSTSTTPRPRAAARSSRRRSGASTRARSAAPGPAPRSRSSTTRARSCPAGTARHRVHARWARPTSSTTRTRRRPTRTGAATSSPSATSATSNDDGYLFLCDRKIDMIISGGVNIYPAEIETVLLDAPEGRRRRGLRHPARRLGRGGEGGGRARRRRRSRAPRSPPRSSPSAPTSSPSTRRRARSTSSPRCRATRTASSTSASCATRTGTAASARSDTGRRIGGTLTGVAHFQRDRSRCARLRCSGGGAGESR